MTDNDWLVRQQRDHNFSTYRWAPIRPKPRRYKFTPTQLAIAVRSAENRKNPHD